MDFDNPYDTLSFDSKIIQEQLEDASIFESAPVSNMEQRVKKHLKENKLIKEQVENDLDKKTIIVENGHLIKGGSGIAGNTRYNIEGMAIAGENDILWDRKTLMLMIIVLVIICIVQYVNYQIMSNNITLLMHVLQKSNFSPLQSIA